jgi:LysM repeat protein
MSPVSRRSLIAVVMLAAVLTVAIAMPMQAAVFQSPPPTVVPPPTHVPPPPPPPRPHPQPGNCSGVNYYVRWGDTLSKIADRYDVSVQDIMRCNGLTSTRIYAGQCLLVPSYGPHPGPMPGPHPGPRPGPHDGWYEVRPGDSVSRIAAHFGVSNWAIINANGLHYPYTIYVGQWLRVP